MRETIKRFEKLPYKQQKLSKEILRQVGERLETELLDSALEENITPFESQNLDIKWKSSEKGFRGQLTMPPHLISLDSLKHTHFVNVTRERNTLLRWALAKGSWDIKRKATRVAGGTLDKFVIGVTPRPFIKRGWVRTQKAIPHIIKSNTQKYIKK